MSKTAAIGILHGKEETFPAAVLQEINSRESSPGAEIVSLGGLFPAPHSRYGMIIDRISHRVPFYRTYLRQQIGLGAWVLPETRALESLDRLELAQSALQLGIPAPPLVALPTKEHPIGVSGEDLFNLVYPLPWDDILAKIGFPAHVRPLRIEEERCWQIDGLRQLWEVYALTGSRQVVLQSAAPAEERLMALVIGEECRVLGYSAHEIETQTTPLRRSALEIPAGSGKYKHSVTSPSLAQDQVKEWSLALTKRWGLSLAGLEWAVAKGQPTLVDFHGCPNLDWWALGETHFVWAVKAVADLAIHAATRKASSSRKKTQTGKVNANNVKLP